ncbi:MAG: hypothetical protein A2W22_03310 [Candidatus Levybacteria bacterium RBG_16_35_11]|nr:MAG: hypothetical protein A2W22_03310 [Candidatus Levybacteria bacterium RBG_16_35_11]
MKYPSPKHNRLPKDSKRGNKKAEAACKGRIDNLRKMLTERGEMTFYDMGNELKVSEKTLTKYIKRLEEKDLIEPFHRPLSKKHQWYRIKPENKSKEKLMLID